MESNKDDALKCLLLGKKALSSSQYDVALRLTKKSLRLYPTPQAEQFLRVLEKTPATISTPANDRKYTAEQVKAVKAVLACGKDYYKVLSIERTASDADIKKAYRKQALQFHPDKNNAPGADEAFKLISKAFNVLSDSNQRVIHDQGGDEIRHRQHHPQYTQRTYHRRHADDLSHEDIFNLFFGSGMRASYNAHEFRQRQDNLRQQQRRQRDTSFVQFMPLILIGILAILGALFSMESQPIYSFQPTSSLSHVRSTHANHIPYYVNPHSFDTQHSRYKLKKLERQIERDWLSELRSRCQNEQRYKSTLLAEADGLLFGILGRNEKAYKEAQKYEMKHCDQLKTLSSKIRY